MIRPYLHLASHLFVSALIAAVFFRDRFLKSFAVLISTMLVDLDHLLADPLYDPNRCSIGFHPLHHYPAIGLYSAALFLPRLRLIAIGLLVHMGLDGIDCAWMTYES